MKHGESQLNHSFKVPMKSDSNEIEPEIEDFLSLCAKIIARTLTKEQSQDKNTVLPEGSDR